MKKIKIGKYDVNVAETIGDISAKRYAAFQVQVLHDETGVSVPSLADFFKKFMLAFDKESKGEMFISVYDFVKSLNKITVDINPKHAMFALISFEENELTEGQYLPVSTDETMLREKIKRYLETGISQEELETYVLNFLKGLIER